jgi:hypothetical protein
MFGFTDDEMAVLRNLYSPKKIQDFLNSLRQNFDSGNDTCMSPRMVLREKKCHCIEGAMLAAAAMRVNGRKPLVLDLKTNDQDLDHVIAVFREGGRWGAISKTNHPFLRYRDPVYRDIRELVMSYFNEYINDFGKLTLRSYSDPVDLSVFDGIGWMTAEKDLWKIASYLDSVRHNKILTRSQIARLRMADKIKIEANDMVEWKK